MEEDCEYLGLIVYESPSGSVTSKDYCQDLCLTFEYSGCKYWSYVKSEKKCYLYESKDLDKWAKYFKETICCWVFNEA